MNSVSEDAVADANADADGVGDASVHNVDVADVAVTVSATTTAAAAAAGSAAPEDGDDTNDEDTVLRFLVIGGIDDSGQVMSTMELLDSFGEYKARR
jgi:hypothetical protein